MYYRVYLYITAPSATHRANISARLTMLLGAVAKRPFYLSVRLFVTLLILA